MKKILVLLIIVCCTNGCAQIKKEEKINDDFRPMNFLINNGDLKYSAGKNGMIRFRCYYGESFESENPFGNAQVYMIHKNGGDWWMKQAKEKYPEMPYPEDWFVEDLYKSQDTSKLNDYHKWAFYIDKKFLKAETSGGGEKDIVYTSYHPTYPYTVILYEQKTGSDKWLEIDRKTFQSEEEKIKENCEWECGFYNNKLKELNEEFKK